MSATQQERHKAANGLRASVRAQGYLHGLYGCTANRGAYHPDYSFAYDAGHRDGTAAREAALTGAAT